MMLPGMTQPAAPSNKRMKLTAPLGAARRRMQAAPRARHSASAVAAAYAQCSTDADTWRRSESDEPICPDVAPD
jgi:hypothetical protein